MSSVEKLNCPDLPPAKHIYSHAAKSAAGLILCSGQIGQDANGKLPDGVEAQCEQALSNLAKVLETAGSDWEHVLKVEIFLKRMEDFNKINVIYEKTLPSPKPARTCIQAGKLPRDCDIEIQCMAVAK